MEPLRICMMSAEVTPFAKTGGLGDATASLARYLHRAGHEVRLFMPRYGCVQELGHPLVPVEFLRDVPISIGPWHYRYSVYTAPLPDSDLWVYFIDCPELYGRPWIYTEDLDEHRRFLLLSRVTIECCQRMGWSPHILHCHDWHTAVAPLYLRTIYAWDRLFQATKSVLTIHNIGYQGVFAASVVPDLDLRGHEHRLHQEDLRRSDVNFLKTGLLSADVLTTVSETYAREIQTPEFGMGLDAILRARSDSVIGILNGVDYGEWNPEIDSRIPYHYSVGDLSGKEKNKRFLLESMDLKNGDDAPVLGMITRLVPQKGLELMTGPLPQILARRDVRVVVLGAGEPQYEGFFSWLQHTFPERVSFYRGYNNLLAGLIEAGSDMYLMPSRYEPCGLNQMYSLRYGTVPIVRRTGGLADTVKAYDPVTGEGTGFVFDAFTPDAFYHTTTSALELYPDRDRWRGLMRNGMAQDYSWEKQIQHYVRLYAALAGVNMTRDA